MDAPFFATSSLFAVAFYLLFPIFCVSVGGSIRVRVSKCVEETCSLQEMLLCYNVLEYDTP